MAKLKKLVLLLVILALILLGILVLSNMIKGISEQRNATVEEPNNAGNVAGASKTQQAAQELAGLLVFKNPEGPALVNGEYNINTFAPDEIAGKLLAGKVNEAGQEIGNVEVDESRLSVIESSDSAFWQYLTKTSELVKKTSELISRQGIDTSDPSVLDFELLAKIYGDSASDFSALPVPENLLFVHKERIRLLLLYENIFLNLAKYETDPLSASVAMSMLVQVDEDMSSLNSIIIDIINKYKS